MKSEKGITLTALVIYVIIFSATITLVSALSSFIYGNLKELNTETISSEEFNKFNTYFVQDVKSSKNVSVKAEENGDVIITLDSGSRYTYSANENSIYKGKVKIARNIVKFNASALQENNKKLVSINIGTGKNTENANFEKTIKYVLRYW